MAIRTVAQAAADIRLSDAKANQDFEKIRRELIQKATRLEADMAISIPVTVDQNSLRSVANSLSRLQQALPSLVVPVTADTDKVLADIIALTALDVVVEIPVMANIEAAEGEISGLEHTETVIELPVTVNADQALREIIALTEIDAVIRIPVEVVRPKASEIPVSEFPTGPTSFSLQANVADARSQIDSFIAALPPVVLRVLPDTDEFLTGVTTIAAGAEPVHVRVLADTDAVAPAVEAIDLPPIEVPVTAAGVGPGIAVSPGLARFREEMAALEQEGVLLRVLGDTSDAEAKIGALGGGDPPDPIVIPVVADTDQAHADINAIDATATDPVVVPIVGDPDQFVRDLARVTGGGGSGGGGGGGNIPPVVVPVTANTVPAQQQVRAFGSDVEQQSQTHGDRAGSAFGRGFSAAATGVMATAAITLGGVLATSLIEGFQRFTTIQDSTESLTVALQSATEAADLLGNVLNVVRGTPFRLDDFARAATNMVSFGVAAEKVPLFLTAIGEAAATRGSQANQFAQSLSTIYGQIQAIGRINGEDVWQFGNVGVDVLRILGNTMDKTTEEVRKMISEGAVTSEFALDAITQGILNGTEGINGATVAFSGTMERLGDTLSGSIENFGAARARFGVAIIRPLSDTMIAGFKSFTAVIDDFSARVEPVFKGLAESPLIEGLNDFFENAPDLIQPTIDALEDLGPALAPIGIAVGALGLGALGAVLGPFGALIPGITSLTGAITVFGASAALLTPEIRDALIPALKELGEVGLAIGGTLVEGIGAGIEGVAPTVVRALEVLKSIGPEIETLFTQAFGAIGELGPKTVPILENIVTFAEEALPVAFRAASQGVAVLSGILDAALPIVNQLVLAATDLIPTFDAILDVTADVGGVLIPVLSTVGELIGDIPVGVLQTLLGVFLGFKAVSFFEGQITGMSRALTGFQNNLKFSSLMFNQFRISGQSSFEALRSTIGQMTKTGSLARGFGSAVAGAFSGMALAAEDSATRITGAVGAIGSVISGFATAGAVGGALALAGVGVGLLAQGFIDGQEEAKELERSVESLADKIRAEFDDELINLEGVINSRVFVELVDETLGPEGIELLDQVGFRIEDMQAAANDGKEAFDEFFNNLIIQAANVKNINFAEPLAVQFEDFAKLISVPLGELKIAVAQGAGAFEGLEITPGMIPEAQLLVQTFEELGPLAGIFDTVTKGTERAAAAERVLGQEAADAGDDKEDASNRAADAAEEYRKMLLEEGITYEELREQAKLLGDENVDAADRASEAWERFGSVLDAVKQRMDLTIQTQNLDQDMRDLGDTLSEIVNTDDIKKADQIGGNIAEADKRIAALKVRLADETAQGDIIRADLDRQIANAERIGAVNAASSLRAEREASFDDANKVLRDIDEEIAKIAELRGELRELVTTPITVFQTLARQAAEANMSMFEFLLAAPTPEAQRVFQDEMAGSVSAAIEQAKTVGAVEGPLAGQAAAESFRTAFRENLVAQGFDQATADALTEKLWPKALLAESAADAATTAVESFNDQIDADLLAEPGTIDLRVELGDLTEQRAELAAFALEHPELKLTPVLQDLDAGIADLWAKDAQEKVAAALLDKQVTDLERFGGIQAVQRVFPRTLTDAQFARNAMNEMLKQAQDAADEEDPIELKAKIVQVEKTRDEFENTMADLGIKIPGATLIIDKVDLLIDEANKQAMMDEILSILPPILGGTAGIAENAQEQVQAAILRKAHIPEFLIPGGGRNFAEGGIHGFGMVDTPHTAQIAHGYRLWAEPETGGEAYIPLGMGKRVGALGVFMKVAEILDMDVRPRRDTPVFDINVPDVNVPEIRIPEVAKMFQAADARSQSADIGTVVRNAMVDAMHAVRRPVTQEDLERNVVVERIEHLVIGPGETPRKRASEFIREMRLRAARL